MPTPAAWYEAAQAALARERNPEPASPRVRRLYCGDCDGVGWTEGGEELITTCARCGGSGILES